MKEKQPLYLWHQDRRVASLTAGGLRYDEDWIQDPDAFPLSHTLPKQSTPLSWNRAWRWLVNLLPEGDARRRIVARLQLSQDNDFELLKALGNDCAGAIRIHVDPEESGRAEPQAHYRRLQPAQLDALANQPGAVAQLLNQDIRLSLAGAQDKISVRVCEDGSLWLPLFHAPSTHLLKCPNPNFSNLVINEFYCMQLAQAIGLKVAPCQLHATPSGQWLLLLTRFDREEQPLAPSPAQDQETCQLNWVARLHQEDFAQALGRAHFEKYESEGGPSFADCIALLRSSARRPTQEMVPLMRWLIYCLVIGNRDNHAKNIARLHHQGHWTLAPFYDLVCTRAYQGLSLSLAMSIGGERDPARITESSWMMEAKRCRIGGRIFVEQVQALCQEVREHLKPTLERVVREHELDADRLSPVIKAINKGLRATERSVY